MQETTVKGYVIGKRRERAELRRSPGGIFELRSQSHYVKFSTRDEETAKKMAEEYSCKWGDVEEEAPAPAKPDPRSVVLDVVREIQKRDNKSVSVGHIILISMGMGLLQQETEFIIDELKADGMIYDPERNGRYKVVQEV